MNHPSAWRRAWPAWLALAVVPLIASWPVVGGWLTVDPIYTLSGLGTHLVPGPLPGGTGLDPNAGVTTEAMGHFAAREWLAGRVPWWNPYDGVGLPMPAEGQNQALFLPFVLLLALRNGPLFLLLALQEVAAFSTYALLRRMALGRAAAWTGAALFAVNGTFAWLGHGPMMPVAFLPLLLLGIEMQWRADKKSSAGWVVAAVAVAFSLYAGFPETAYLDGLLGAAWTLSRIAQCDRARRVAFASRMGLAALAGLLLAAPFVVPFAHMLTVSDLALHAVNIGTIGAPPAALPMLVMPYLLGPQSFGWHDPSGVLVWLWDFLGGYVSLPVAFLSVVAVLAPRARDRLLRWLLAGWIVAMVSASFRVPGITQLVYAIPAMAQTQVFRYSPPSWELAAIVLAAMAVDDWKRGTVRRRRVGIALALVLGGAGIGVAAASGSIAYLLAAVPRYDVWLIASLAGASICFLTVAAILAARSTAWRTALLALLLLGDGVALFSVPRLAGLRRPSLDTTAIAFLRRNLGLQRIYALGPLMPNYPAYFEVASINADYLPTPKIWTEHIPALDPASDRNAFTGVFQWPGLPMSDHIAQLRTHLRAYEELAVKYVLVPAGQDLAPTARTPTATQGAEAFGLDPGARMDVTVPAATFTPGLIESVAVEIGTFLGAANGHLEVTACAGAACRDGTADIAAAADNRPLELRLNAPLPIGPGQDLRLTIAHVGGTVRVAIWRYPQASGAAPLPGLTFRYAMDGPPARRVFANELTTIYELPNPAPYFEIDGNACHVAPVSREVVTTDCPAPARLIRRELFFPGWRATINGTGAAVLRAAPILQAVDVPAGPARIEFHYAPPYAGASTAAFAIGLMLVAAGCIGRPYRYQ
jgi:hypothetical protein